MLSVEDRIFTNILCDEDTSLKSAMKRGEWQNTLSLIQNGSEWIIEQMLKAKLRGRGGAGFDTGKKWSFVPKQKEGAKHYLVINADESEPGTCKDKYIIRYEPHKILEGALIAARAINATVCYIYIRYEYYEEYAILENAINEAYQAGFLGKNACKSGWDLMVYLHRGAGAYICGEESALLESLEGKKGLPRLKPPFPAIAGLYGCPTVVNNVETIATVSTILKRGPSWFTGLGKVNNHGTKLYCVSGHVNKQCVFEEEMGINMRVLIDEYAHGVIGGWDNLMAVIPGGSSMPLLPAHMCDKAEMDFDSLSTLGSGLGTGCMIVIKNGTDLVKVIKRIAYFYKDESCGQCSPCREGTGWMYRILGKFDSNKAEPGDIEKLYDITTQICGRTICALGDAAAWPIQGLIKHFRPILESKIMRSFILLGFLTISMLSNALYANEINASDINIAQREIVPQIDDPEDIFVTDPNAISIDELNRYKDMITTSPATILDDFILPEDMAQLLYKLPSGTNDSVQYYANFNQLKNPQEYQEKVAEYYLAMKRRVLVRTMRL